LNIYILNNNFINHTTKNRKRKVKENRNCSFCVLYFVSLGDIVVNTLVNFKKKEMKNYRNSTKKLKIIK